MQKFAAQKVLLVLTKDGRVLVNTIALDWTEDELRLLRAIIQRFSQRYPDDWPTEELAELMKRDGEFHHDGGKRYVHTRREISQKIRAAVRTLPKDFEVLSIYPDGTHPPKNVECQVLK